MPDKPVSSQSVGKAVVTLFRSLAFAGSVMVSAVALFAAGCTDDSGNGHFIPPGLTVARVARAAARAATARVAAAVMAQAARAVTARAAAAVTAQAAAAVVAPAGGAAARRGRRGRGRRRRHRWWQPRRRRPR